ncbi:MAG: YbhB/YbcL family Raf kinase inhibitor-like protein [Dehalococcoidales bacterium]|nr:YbhB/YbcL family Raf kinase inhibitor-like protein [Dehalococcoidales bacterium]
MLTISSPEFKNNENIPPRFTGEGKGVSPALVWENVPPNTKSLAMIMDDPDAPSGLFTHWIIFNIPPDSKVLKEAIPNIPQLPDGSLQGENTSGSIGYYGPFPPVGPRHRYQFTIYALDQKLNIKAGASRQQLDQAMKGHVIEQNRLTGTYQRGRK